MPQIKAVLFDLDGTLADTAPDLAQTLNSLLQENAKAPLPFHAIRPHVSHGALALLKLGFPEYDESTLLDKFRDKFLAYYRKNLTTHTRLFPGMTELLEQLETADIPWGVVTNKPAFLTNPLMEELNLHQRAKTIISGDTTTNKKPHPEPIRLACKHIQVNPRQAIYVGDAKRDIQAGNAAGLITLAALFGYINTEDKPEQWGADALINHPSEVSLWLR